ncbi:LPS export ABC transporter permease LptF [Arenimonas fontis]|uniref:Lipopolysaccharide export system permease protein LptF n=1 Tax=Arenimonas fontis TaxID=2608255 RepID=A0A5B2ZD42_9GAMM|nr:LPS export ABC transporter permease LptF [Arenimonas fontis]KAA2284991.1 LPS export ABC transporter permease LptF [Arenimonas fontis]
MRLIERYLAREFAASVAAVAIVLLLVGLGGLLVDLMSEIARGKVPAGLLLSQLGLRSIQVLPVLLPLALFIGLLLCIGRMYGESEMSVLAAVGLGPQALWRPLAMVVLPVAAIIAASALWAAPLGARIARDMVDTANRSFLVAGLEAGRFRELPGRSGIIYVGELSTDGTKFRRLFVQAERDGRVDVITAADGEMRFEGEVERYLLLRDGFRVEGAPGALDFRMMRFAENEMRVPDREVEAEAEALEARPTGELLRLEDAPSRAELHWRLATPLLALALGLLAMPLGRGSPRQARHGRVLAAILIYVNAMALLVLGKGWLADGSIAAGLGLWWVLVPLLSLSLWWFLRDGRLRRPGRAP